jgi:ATP-dependent DNA helicase 2 subunit 2
MDLEHLPELQSKIAPSSTNAGDAISAIVLAVQLITEFTTLKSGKLGAFARKIVLLTDGQGMIDGQGIEQIANRINECGITLVVV